MLFGFNVTYEIVTPESAEHGDADERGFIIQNGRFRSAVESLFETRSNTAGGIAALETSAWPEEFARWFTVINGPEFDTGAVESRSIHWPDSITPASKARVIRLCKRGHA